jgi:hypothetical protein
MLTMWHLKPTGLVLQTRAVGCVATIEGQPGCTVYLTSGFPIPVHERASEVLALTNS